MALEDEGAKTKAQRRRRKDEGAKTKAQRRRRKDEGAKTKPLLLFGFGSGVAGG
ncbi:unannotated protein [freshwater metagenome]|uniref:Unannotated protein n=1 Tax=freshwater metagenome TaxID=449393 RepID=A0A6J7IK10_9ZZZZ